MNLVFARVHLEVTREERFTPGKLSDLVKRHGLHTQAQEAIWLVSNDRHGNVHTIIEVARGSHDAVALDIASAMTAVLATGAPAFSVAHNHPTMSVLPSQSDISLTHDLMDAANILGLLFEDHVIVDSTGDSFSFREAKMINGATRLSTRSAHPPDGHVRRKSGAERMEACRIHERCDRSFRPGSAGASNHQPRVDGQPVDDRPQTASK